ncbi:MAG: SCO6745 family protein [Ilumatobacteraceae bacterium]
MDFARSLWMRIETLHAVTYFGEETNEAAKVLGMPGFWSSYFGFRAAPMGPVDSGLVEAVFFNFAPSFVRRWVPVVWTHASPELLIAARSLAAERTLTRLFPGIADVATQSNAALEAAVDRCSAAGRPLFAANRMLPLPDAPVARFWQLCTTLREHRGDGHVSVLTAHGLDGLEAHVLIALEQENSAEDLQKTRGWTAAEWAQAVARCTDNGWVEASGVLSAAGRALRQEIETATDRLANQPFDVLDPSARDALLVTLAPAAEAISGSGVIRYPNPMGLPPIRDHLDLH